VKIMKKMTKELKFFTEFNNKNWFFYLEPNLLILLFLEELKWYWILTLIYWTDYSLLMFFL
jgi:hypothetical protein